MSLIKTILWIFPSQSSIFDMQRFLRFHPDWHLQPFGCLDNRHRFRPCSLVFLPFLSYLSHPLNKQTWSSVFFFSSPSVSFSWHDVRSPLLEFSWIHDERMWSASVADKNEEWHSNVFPLVFNEKARREEWDKQLPFRTSIFLLFPSFSFLFLEFHPLQGREDQHVYDTPSSWLTSLVLKECHEKHKKWRETLRWERKEAAHSSCFPSFW